MSVTLVCSTKTYGNVPVKTKINSNPCDATLRYYNLTI